jgi:hypothetical protein
MKAKLSLPVRTQYFRDRTRVIYHSIDPGTIRLMLAVASFLWAAGAVDWFIPRMVFTLFGLTFAIDLHFDPFSRHGYEIMAAMAPAWVWAILFTIHGLGVFWRFYDAHERLRWHLAVNVFGFVLWLTATLALNVGLGTISPFSSPEWTMILASGMALVLTGKRPEAVSL